MMWWIIGAVVLTALIFFCLRWVYFAGYRAGVTAVLIQWKQTIIDAGEMEDEQIIR